MRRTNCMMLIGSFHTRHIISTSSKLHKYALAHLKFRLLQNSAIGQLVLLDTVIVEVLDDLMSGLAIPRRMHRVLLSELLQEARVFNLQDSEGTVFGKNRWLVLLLKFSFATYPFQCSSSFLDKILVNFILVLLTLLLRVFIIFLFILLLHEQTLVLGEVHREVELVVGLLSLFWNTFNEWTLESFRKFLQFLRSLLLSVF